MEIVSNFDCSIEISMIFLSCLLNMFCSSYSGLTEGTFTAAFTIGLLKLVLEILYGLLKKNFAHWFVIEESKCFLLRCSLKFRSLPTGNSESYFLFFKFGDSYFCFEFKIEQFCSNIWAFLATRDIWLTKESIYLGNMVDKNALNRCFSLFQISTKLRFFDFARFLSLTWKCKWYWWAIESIPISFCLQIPAKRNFGAV